MYMFDKTSDELTKRENIIYNIIKIGVVVWVVLTIIAMVTMTFGIRFRC